MSTSSNIKKASLVSVVAACGLALGGCGLFSSTATAVLPPHPNQLSTLDGETYDALLAAKGGIDNAKGQIAAGTLASSDTAKVNAAIVIYNQAEADWVAYRDTVIASPALATTGPAYTKLSADYAQLIQTIAALKTL